MIRFLKIGSDPEFFIRDSETKEYLPSFYFTEGTKTHPLELGNDYKIIKDNIVIEGNIPPAGTKEEWINNMLFLKNKIKEAISVISTAQIFEGDIAPFKREFINTEDGQSFGCSTFIDAWENQVKTSPIFFDKNRTCGCHVHISYDITEDSSITNKEVINIALARALDFFLGIPSDSIFYCKKRRDGYGTLGAFRNTSYGMEYRPLGGHFAKDIYLGWIYEQVQKAISWLNIDGNFSKILSLENPDIRHYNFLEINFNDQIKIK